MSCSQDMCHSVGFFGEHIKSLERERDALASVLLQVVNVSSDTMNVLKEANFHIDSLALALVMAVKTSEQVQVRAERSPACPSCLQRVPAPDLVILSVSKIYSFGAMYFSWALRLCCVPRLAGEKIIIKWHIPLQHQAGIKKRVVMYKTSHISFFRAPNLLCNRASRQLRSAGRSGFAGC